MDIFVLVIAVIVAAIVIITSINSFIIGLIIMRVRSPTRNELSEEEKKAADSAQKKAKEMQRAFNNLESYDGEEQ